MVWTLQEAVLFGVVVGKNVPLIDCNNQQWSIAINFFCQNNECECLDKNDVAFLEKDEYFIVFDRIVIDDDCGDANIALPNKHIFQRMITEATAMRLINIHINSEFKRLPHTDRTSLLQNHLLSIMCPTMKIRGLLCVHQRQLYK